MIAQRLASILALAGRFEMLPNDQADAHLREVWRLLADWDPRRDRADQCLDATHLIPSEIGDWLSTQGLGNELVKVCWPYDREVAVMSVSDFVENLDDLWYPSADDVVVLPTSERFVLYLDHEEQVFLSRKDEELASDRTSSVSKEPVSDHHPVEQAT
jgi:hypothetical protein